MSQPILFATPEEVIESYDIEDPDKVIDALLEGIPSTAEQRHKIETMKLLDHRSKVRWLLGLPGQGELTDNPVMICTTVVVVTIITVVVGSVIVNGATKLITEKRRQEKEQQKCLPKEQ